MADIIQFPAKDDFFNKFGESFSNLPCSGPNVKDNISLNLS